MDSEMSSNSGPIISFHLWSGLIKPIAELNTSFLQLCQETVTIILHARGLPPRKRFPQMLGSPERELLGLASSNPRG